MTRLEYILTIVTATVMIWGGWWILTPVETFIYHPRRELVAFLGIFFGIVIVCIMAGFTVIRTIQRIYEENVGDDANDGVGTITTVCKGETWQPLPTLGSYMDYPTLQRKNPIRWQGLRHGLRLVGSPNQMRKYR